MIAECSVVMMATGMLSVDGRGMFGCYDGYWNAEC